MSTLVSDPGHVNPLDSSNYPASAEVPASSAAAGVAGPGKGCLIEAASPPAGLATDIVFSVRLL